MIERCRYRLGTRGRDEPSVVDHQFLHTTFDEVTPSRSKGFCCDGRQGRDVTGHGGSALGTECGDAGGAQSVDRCVGEDHGFNGYRARTERRKRAGSPRIEPCVCADTSDSQGASGGGDSVQQPRRRPLAQCQNRLGKLTQCFLETADAGAKSTADDGCQSSDINTFVVQQCGTGATATNRQKCHVHGAPIGAGGFLVPATVLEPHLTYGLKHELLNAGGCHLGNERDTVGEHVVGGWTQSMCQGIAKSRPDPQFTLAIVGGDGVIMGEDHPCCCGDARGCERSPGGAKCVVVAGPGSAGGWSEAVATPVIVAQGKVKRRMGSLNEAMPGVLRSGGPDPVVRGSQGHCPCGTRHKARKTLSRLRVADDIPGVRADARSDHNQHTSGGTVQHLVITGGAGRVATSLRPRLAREGRSMLLLDIRGPQPTADDAAGESSALVGVDDLAALTAAFQGAAAVIHLGGHSSERPWAEILHTNINGTHNVFEAAHRAGVPRVLVASSIHAVGYHPAHSVVEEPVPAGRPDGFYGVGKVAMEALGSLYADRLGLKVLSLRIANFAERPNSQRGLSLWLSPNDLARAVEAFLLDSTPGHRIAWGVSNNTRRLLDPSAGIAFGFAAVDDAEQFADEVPVQEESWDGLLAGGFLAPGRELGQPFS